MQQNLPSSSNASTSLPQSSQISAEKIASAIACYGPEYREFVFNRYNTPSSIENAVNTPAPSFHDVTNFFGREATLFWLRFHIAETFFFLGIYDSSSKYQVRQTADLILTHEVYGQLTLSEFLAFLTRFKRGDYGKIYQSARPNPQEFLACLQPFWQELVHYRAKKDEHDRQERLSRDLHSPDNMTREEWEEIKMLTKMYEMQIEKGVE